MKLNIHNSDFSEVVQTKLDRLKEHRARVSRYKNAVKNKPTVSRTTNIKVNKKPM